MFISMINIIISVSRSENMFAYHYRSRVDFKKPIQTITEVISLRQKPSDEVLKRNLFVHAFLVYTL